MKRIGLVLLALVSLMAASVPTAAQSPSPTASPTAIPPLPDLLVTPYATFLASTLPGVAIFQEGLHGNWSQAKAQVDMASAELSAILLTTYPDPCYLQGFGEMWQLVGALRSISYLLGRHDVGAYALFGKALDFAQVATFDDGTRSCAVP